MDDIPGRSCLVTDLDDLFVAPPLSRTTRRRPHRYGTCADSLPDPARTTAGVGRPVTICCTCNRPAGDGFVRRSKSGKIFCLVCADQAVESYYSRHPEARPVPERIAAERTSVAYLAERERYAVRYHAGNARWQISDTQTRRWTSFSSAQEHEAQAEAARRNTLWRTQIESEFLAFGSHDVPSTAPRHTVRVGESRYDVDPA